MLNKIPWLSDIKEPKSQLNIPIDTITLYKFIKSMQSPEGFCNSLEEMFWALVGLIKLGKSSEINQKALISHVLKHRMGSGGFTSKIEGELADIESTFYAIGLLYMAGLFAEDVSIESFCPECGQRQLFKTQVCFNCNASLTPDLTHCAICNKPLQSPPVAGVKWVTLCETCQSGFLQDLEYIQNVQKQGFKEEGKKVSYKTAFFTLNTLMILDSFENIINLKKLSEFLQKNQYPLEVERIFQILCYYLLKNEEKIDLLPFLGNLTSFQHKDSGFGLDKKTPGISDTFWSVLPFFLMKKIDLVQLGPIHQFVSGLRRESDGGYAEKIMDTRSNLVSTIQAYLTFMIISDYLNEQIEEAILKAAISVNKIYLAPLGEKNFVSSDFVEGIAYHLLSKTWFVGKILDQLDFFQGYLEKSNILTQKIGKGLISIAGKQSEISLSEFGKNLEIANAEERVKTVIIDFLANKFLEGEIRKGKKGFVFQEVRLPRKFIFLENEVPVEAIFKEKAQVSPKREFIETQYHQLLDFIKIIEEEVLKLIEKGEPDEARKKLELEHSNFFNKLEDYEKNLTEIPSEFKYLDFKDIMMDFFREWPIKKQSLTLYLNKIEGKLINKIEEKEKFKAHDALLSKEQRIIENFDDYLRIFSDKIELLTNNFKTSYQQQYTNPESANTQITQINENISAFSQDLSEKKAQLEGSLEISQKPEKINKGLDLLNSKINFLREIAAEASKISALRENFPKQSEESIKIFKENLAKSQVIINEKIESKNFDLASKELEIQDENFKNFKATMRSQLETTIKQQKDSLAHFTVAFDDLRTQLNVGLNQLETEWTTQKEELISKSLVQTELFKKTQLKNKMKEFTQKETEKFEALKTNTEKLIKQENVQEAKSKIELAISEFGQVSTKFENEINESIKEITKQFKNFKKAMAEIIMEWNKDQNFIQQSIQTLLDQTASLFADKELLKQKSNLERIIKNQKLLISKDFSAFIPQYREAMEKNNLLNQELQLIDSLKNIETNLKKGTVQATQFHRENSKKYVEFSNLVKTQMESWQKESTAITNSLEKIESNITENILIRKIYFTVKAFQGYKVELKYLAKTLNLKPAQLKDKLVYLLSNAKLEGNLDSMSDMLTLSTLKPIGEATLVFLQAIEKEVGQVLQIDFLKKEAIPKEMEDKKQYLLQLRYLLVIHRSVGATIFHRQFGTWVLNPDLISGFLTAIQSFGSEIKSETAPIRKMSYKGFEILLNQGELIFAALIVDGNTSEWLEQKLAAFTKEFEKEFHSNLKSWSGELTQFKSAGLMVDRTFELFRVYT